MRVRSGRFNELARVPKLRSFLCRVALCFDLQVFDADQSLCFQPRVVEGFLQAWGSRHVPVAVATHPVLNGGDEVDPEGHQILDLRARPAPLLPVAHADAPSNPFVQFGNGPVTLAYGERIKKSTTTDKLKPPTVAQPPFELTPPEVITPLGTTQAKTAVPISVEVQTQVDQQVEGFIAALLAEDVHSEAFKAKLDSAFALGRQEISAAANLMQGSFMQRNFVGVENSSAYKAIADMRGQLDELNPGKDGDLFGPRKLLGVVAENGI
jgi:hypothetical protein